MVLIASACAGYLEPAYRVIECNFTASGSDINDYGNPGNFLSGNSGTSFHSYILCGISLAIGQDTTFLKCEGGRMNKQEPYETIVRRLADCNYEVSADAHGYIVRHQTDTDDISRVRTLDELSELADLMEWAEQRRARQPESQSGQPASQQKA
jgi:hypothetical protein